MRCYANRYGTKLLATLASTTNVDGAGYRILPDQSDNQNDASQDYKVVTSLNVAGGAGTPSAQLVVQGSVDGSTWIDVVLGAVRTAPGTYREVLDGNAALLPWVRVRLVVAGTTPPSVDASAEVVSTGGFTLAAS
jgi:hypothetical protein